MHLLGAASLMLAALSAAPAQELPRNFIVHEEPESGAPIRFEDDQGRAHSLADFRGKFVLVNIWATWCVPCRREIPALDRTAAALTDADFAIVAVSIDRKGPDAIRKVFAELDVRRLAAYVDTSGAALRTARGVGLPTSFVIDPEGRELARIVGPADWDDAAVIAFLRRLVSDARDGRYRMLRRSG